MMIRLIFLLSIILFSTSCKEDDASPDIYTGEASALKNGEDWIAVAYFDLISKPAIANPPTYFLRADVFNKAGFWREAFNIRQFESNFSKQKIVLNSQNEKGLISCDYSTFIDDGDVVGDIYKLDATATNNFIQITNYSSSKAEVEGVFNVSLILSRDDGEGDAPPEKLEFTNGKFRVKVKREWFE
jgi:hypothetical protein